MICREYRPEDCKKMAELFYETVHTVNAADYTEEQLDAWADGQVNLEKWNDSFLEHDTIVAEEDGVLIGFGDMDENGYLDRLYVHKDYQRRGIASEICARLEARAKVRCFETHASVTARPFFEKQGYRAVYEQQVERKGIYLTNFVMKKQI